MSNLLPAFAFAPSFCTHDSPMEFKILPCQWNWCFELEFLLPIGFGICWNYILHPDQSTGIGPDRKQLAYFVQFSPASFLYFKSLLCWFFSSFFFGQTLLALNNELESGRWKFNVKLIPTILPEMSARSLARQWLSRFGCCSVVSSLLAT